MRTSHGWEARSPTSFATPSGESKPFYRRQAAPSTSDRARRRASVMRARRVALMGEIEAMDRFIAALERTHWDPFTAEAMMAAEVG